MNHAKNAQGSQMYQEPQDSNVPTSEKSQTNVQQQLSVFRKITSSEGRVFGTSLFA